MKHGVVRYSNSKYDRDIMLIWDDSYKDDYIHEICSAILTGLYPKYVNLDSLVKDNLLESIVSYVKSISVDHSIESIIEYFQELFNVIILLYDFYIYEDNMLIITSVDVNITQYLYNSNKGYLMLGRRLEEKDIIFNLGYSDLNGVRLFSSENNILESDMVNKHIISILRIPTPSPFSEIESTYIKDFTVSDDEIGKYKQLKDIVSNIAPGIPIPGIHKELEDLYHVKYYQTIQKYNKLSEDKDNSFSRYWYSLPDHFFRVTHGDDVSNLLAMSEETCLDSTTGEMGIVFICDGYVIKYTSFGVDSQIDDPLISEALYNYIAGIHGLSPRVYDVFYDMNTKATYLILEELVGYKNTDENMDITCLYNLFKSFMDLDLLQIYHTDIHPGNNLYKYENDGACDMKIIDFGLTSIENSDMSNMLLLYENVKFTEEFYSDDFDGYPGLDKLNYLLSLNILPKYVVRGIQNGKKKSEDELDK